MELLLHNFFLERDQPTKNDSSSSACMGEFNLYDIARLSCHDSHPPLIQDDNIILIMACMQCSVC